MREGPGSPAARTLQHILTLNTPLQVPGRLCLFNSRRRNTFNKVALQ